MWTSSVSQTDFLVRLAYSLLSFPLVYYSVIYLFSSHFSGDKAVKARAWVLTGYSSAVMLVGSVPVVYQLALDQYDFLHFRLVDGEYVVSLSAFFIAYMISDLLLGVIHYPQYIHPLSGWFHHLLYIVLVYKLIENGVSGIFCVFTILELPTFLLSIGSINRKWRSDWLFGLFYFLTRIMFHLFCTWRLYVAFKDRYYWKAAIAVFPLHVLWFRGWILQQMRKARLANDESSAAKSQASPLKPKNSPRRRNNK